MLKTSHFALFFEFPHINNMNDKNKNKLIMTNKRFQKEDLLLAIQTLQYENGVKPHISQVADFLGISVEWTRYYLKYYDLYNMIGRKSKQVTTTDRNQQIREQLTDMLNTLRGIEEIQQENFFKELNKYLNN